ncbi:putative translin family RNA/ssDNA-binding protein [Clostridium pascui]|uniref:hypothetical protein n=1 Tax=Clostridium pascui TaxID=46609 RepID=UPI00195C161A|nr:hypothetical protein [Clostridium pascui]MBM7871810.1 putative translin family RNA/ssDNA-binding protein [Clostridium pascui]
MAKKSARNNDLLFNSKTKTSPKIYSLLVDLVNEDRENLAKIVLKVDYLLEYASVAIKQRDFDEAREALEKANDRINKLIQEGVNTEHLEYLYEGIEKKVKK